MNPSTKRPRGPVMIDVAGTALDADCFAALEALVAADVAPPRAVVAA